MFTLERLNSMLREGCTEGELEEFLLSGTRKMFCQGTLNEKWRQARLKGDDMKKIALLLQEFGNGTPERYGFLENKGTELCDRLRQTRFVDSAVEDADIGAEKLLVDWIICVARYDSPLQNGLCELSAGSMPTSTEYLAALSLAMIRKTSLTWFEQEVRPLKRKALACYKRRHPDAGRADSSWYLPDSAKGWKADTDYIEDMAKNDLPDVLRDLPAKSEIKAVCTEPDVVKLLLCGQTPNINDPVKALESYLKVFGFSPEESEPFELEVQKLAAYMEENWKELFRDLFQPKPKVKEGMKLPQRGLQMVLRLLLGASTGMMGGETAQRGSIIRAAFAIEADCETLDQMLYSFDLAGIDYKDGDEQIFGYSLSTKRSYNFASLMVKAYEMLCKSKNSSGEEQSEWRPTQYWRRDSAERYGNAGPERFLSYLWENGFRTGKRKTSGMQHIFTSREFYTLCRFNSLKLHVVKEQYDRLCAMTKTVQDALKDLNVGRVDESQKNDYLMWRDMTLADESTIYAQIKAEMIELMILCRDPKDLYQKDAIRGEISVLISQLKKGDFLTRSQFLLLSLCEHKVRAAPYDEFRMNLEKDLANSRYEPLDETPENAAFLEKAKEILSKEHDER